MLAAHELVAAAVAHALHVGPGRAVTGEVLTEYPIPRLVSESRHAQLVVVGERGVGGLPGMLVGSVAVAVAAHAACPVVVVRGPEPDSESDVLRPVVGVGEPLDCEPALRFAFEAAAARAVPLVAVHAWRCPVLLVPGAAVVVGWDAVAADECQGLLDTVARWGKKFPAVRMEQVVVRGDPARELAEHGGSARGGRHPGPQQRGQDVPGSGQPRIDPPCDVPGRCRASRREARLSPPRGARR